MKARFIRAMGLALLVSFLSVGGYVFLMSENLDRRLDGLNQQGFQLEKFEESLNEQKAKGVGFSNDAVTQLADRKSKVEREKEELMDSFWAWAIGIGLGVFTVVILVVFLTRFEEEKKFRLQDLSSRSKT